MTLMTACSRILLTPGEPAGIGPDITIQIAQQAWQHDIVAIADPHLLIERARELSLPLAVIEIDPSTAPTPHQPGSIKVIPIPLQEPVVPGVLNAKNAHYVIRTLELGATLCLKQQAHALVTGPVNKAILNDAGIAFSGHTEFFATYTQSPLTVMLFVLDNMRIALTTTHLPLKEVPAAITPERLQATLHVLRDGLMRHFQLTAPRISVAGLNPHAGENGHLGREEIDIITPVIHHLQNEGWLIAGPYSADTIFTPASLSKADAILAMYHDQALPLVKYAGFSNAVNITLGLPFIRTSVDHGTALDLAGSGATDASSLQAAISLAISLQH